MSSDGPLPVLRLKHVSKAFPGVQAVRGVDFDVHPGEIHALVGENGAGKTTLMAIASGVTTPDLGVVELGDTELKPGQNSRHLGLLTAYQDDSLVPDLTVTENLMLSLRGELRAEIRDPDAWTQNRLGVFATEISARSYVRDLSVAGRQIVEIVKVIAADPKVIVLDEPTSALASDEVERLFDALRQAVDRGVAVVYITHRLPEVFEIATAVSVMRDGEMVATRLQASQTTETEIVDLMVGRSVDAAFPTKRVAADEKDRPLVTINDFNSVDFREVDFGGYRGEILGLAGIEGNGQREVLRAVAGLEPHEGEVSLDGKKVPTSDPSSALGAGISYLSSDRRGEGLLIGLGVRENMTITSLEELARLGVVSRRREVETVAREISKLDLKTPSIEQPVSVLSGGNQQKVALGRVFLENPIVYVADEPTRGVDVGARSEIYAFLREAAEQGAVVLVVSSDAVELAGLCDRVLVFARGKIVQELSGTNLTEGGIVGAAARSRVTRAASEDGERSRSEKLWSLRTSDFTPVVLLLAAMVALGVAMSFADPLFVSTTNLGNLLFLAVPFAFAALGQAAVFLIGGIDLSIGPLIALVTVTVASVMQAIGGEIGVFAAILAALGVGAALGLVNALLVRKAGLIPLIATLATFILIQGFALLWRPIPGGFVSLGFLDGASGRISFVPWSFLLVVAIAIAGEYWYRRRIGGLWLRAVGSRSAAATRLGAPTEHVYFGAYIAAGLFGAIGGIFFTGTIGIGDATLGVKFTLLSITAVVLGGLSTWGGRGSIIGPVLGAVLLAMIANMTAFLNLDSDVQFFVEGGLALAAIAVYSRLRATGTGVYEAIAK